MKKQITAIIITSLLLINITACSAENGMSGVQESSNTEGSENISSYANDKSSTENSSDIDSSVDTPKGGNGYDNEVAEANYRYDHAFDNVIKIRGVYGETEIPDIHYENANSDGCVTHSPSGNEWQYYGLESMEFERHTFGDYTIKLVGNYVRTDKEHFPDRIFAGGVFTEVEKNGEIISTVNVSPDITGIAGAQYSAEKYILIDKIGRYDDIYDLENPVVAMRYWFADQPERRVYKAVDFFVLKGECRGGHVGVCEPGCGVAVDFEFTDECDTNTVNSEFTNCRAVLFEAEEFTVVDEKTLFDEVAGITYTFDFTEHPVTHLLPFELYTAEKNVGSVAAAGETKKTYA